VQKTKKKSLALALEKDWEIEIGQNENLAPKNVYFVHKKV